MELLQIEPMKAPEHLYEFIEQPFNVLNIKSREMVGVYYEIEVRKTPNKTYNYKKTINYPKGKVLVLSEAKNLTWDEIREKLSNERIDYYGN